MSKSNCCNVICSWNLPNAFHFIRHLDDSSQPIGVLWKFPFWKPPNTSTIPFETPSRSYDVCLWNWIVQFCADTFLSFAAGFLQTSTSWWFQPIWKIWVKLNHFPQVGVKIKNIWNHHLVYHVCRDFGDFDASMVYFTMAKITPSSTPPLLRRFRSK